MSKLYNITTFGCQMNEHDSEIMAGLLEELGYCPVQSGKDADVAIINTCSVRENADKRFFGTLGQLKKIKETRPDFIVAVCGCMMQQQHIVDTLKSKYPWVDIVFGTHNIHELPVLLKNVREEHNKQLDVWVDSTEIVEGLPARRLYEHKALVNIMYGCNNFCTYCIVPYTRGREKSRKHGEIVSEIKALVTDGVKEVMLLGQNVNSYKGEDGTDFPALLYMLNEIEGLRRIRFMTSHPKDLSDRLIKAFAECTSLCAHIHLPVQSGSSRVLKRMNRRYTKEDYILLTEKLRRACPNITITTDIIVGFPGETDADFEETLDLVRSVRFDSAFTFLYSVRKGTPAAEYDDQIPEDVKHARFNRLVEAVNNISAEKNKAYEGKILEVLVEGPSKNNIFNFTGRTDGFKLVNFKGDDIMAGQFVNVEITEGKTFSLEGRVIK